MKQKKLIDNDKETFINTNGYLEYKHSQGKGSNLVHRRIAFKEVYDYKKYPYSFGEYEVHHKNGKKLDNRPENFELQLPTIHHAEHFGTYKEQQERERQMRIKEVLKREGSSKSTIPQRKRKIFKEKPKHYNLEQWFIYTAVSIAVLIYGYKVENTVALWSGIILSLIAVHWLIKCVKS